MEWNIEFCPKAKHWDPLGHSVWNQVNEKKWKLNDNKKKVNVFQGDEHIPIVNKD